MSPGQLRSARQSAGLTQQRAADRLGVSQPYLALIELGRRPIPSQLGSRIIKLYRLGPASLPLDVNHERSWDSSSLARALASLKYPGFPRSTGARLRNPANVLLAAIAASDIEVRVLEALPWIAIEYDDLDWEWLIREAKVQDLQNRLGFVVTLARQVAVKCGNDAAAKRLHDVKEILCRARLRREDTLCQASLTEAERRWLRKARPPEARYWNLLTDLKAHLLPYAA